LIFKYIQASKDCFNPQTPMVIHSRQVKNEFVTNMGLQDPSNSSFTFSLDEKGNKESLPDGSGQAGR
jgi:hypothetical protein